jgi:hypothetical protein
MDAFFSWANANWFNLVQTLGIMGSLFMTAAAAHRDAKSREVENLLALNGQHREFWAGVLEKPELKRLFQDDSDILEKPVTMAEREFLNLAFVHYETGWKVAKAGALITLAEIKADVHDFFSLPLPRAAWERTKSLRNRPFVRFVERALR